MSRNTPLWGWLMLPPTILMGSILPMSGTTTIHELTTFDLAGPSHSGWKLMVQGPDSIWFHRARSPEQYLMIGAMAFDIPFEQSTTNDTNLARAIMEEYHKDSGHSVRDEAFEKKWINGRQFFAGSVTLPSIHSVPVQPGLVAREWVYVHIDHQKKSGPSKIYLFTFTDVFHEEVSFENDLEEFLTVLRSFKVKGD